MRYLFAIIVIISFCADLIGQKASYTTEPIYVKLKGDHPTELIIRAPANLQAKNRGFTRVKSKKLLVEGNVNDDDGIELFLINNFQVSVGEDGYFYQLININEGENELIFSLIDKKKNSFNQTYTVFGEKTNEDPLATIENSVGKYYALLIGVDEYMDPEVTDLDKPVRDANMLKDALVSNYTFDEENITLLKNATRAEIIDELARLRKTITPADNLLLFYAGHGYYDEASDIGYWIPSDGRKNSTANWFRNSTLSDEISAIKSKHTLLIADACFSGSIFKSRKFFDDGSLAINKLYELPSRKAMTSGALTEVPDRSAFINYLTKRLGGNTDKYLTSEQLFSSFRLAVINNSDVVPQYGTIQKAGDEGGDFIFIRRD